ncbi:hypothetical protein O0L34_g1610 [Tuta absoluta]|nr:hypothetical protein O0L34_g1610 [Tuta absoluta]
MCRNSSGEEMAGMGAELGPVAAAWNATTLDLADITMDRNFFLLVAALCTSVAWVVYMSYYNSRLLGFLLTRLVNKFYFQDDNFKIGSITLNALSGKIMFRDIVYITYDYTLRIQDGYLIFRWWRSYIPKDVSEDLSHSDTRLSIVLNGFELHVYNRSDLYAELERTFGLEACMRGGGGGGAGGGDPPPGAERAMNDANEKRRRRRAQEAAVTEAALARTWRDLIPVIKADVCSARVVFGNRLVPTTLSVSVEEAHLVYSTKPPASSLDHLMHFVKAKADNCKVLLAPSPNYTAMVDEPPRYMGEGFVVMSSNYVEVYFYMDEPGLVPERPVLLQLANGDVVESAPPIWGVDIKCGKGTDFSYGPWADRQRDHLFKFFFPPDYKNMEVTPQPKPGDRRQMQSFDIRLSTLNEATIDILFTKNKETNAVHINIGAGSYLEMTLPWIVLQDGYTTKITGQLLHLEATTSLQYRSFAESETLEFNVKCHYPLVWNHHQCWQLSLTGCKATAHFVYTHIEFFQDLVNDWASKARPDILHFVPYTWKISLLLKECEVVTVSNQYNWIDCSSTNQENNHVAFCGDLLDVSFDLPFIDFLPDTIPLKIWVQGEAVDMSLYLPEVNTSRLLLLSLDKNMKLVPCRFKASKWRRKCVKSQGWVDCWSVPIIALSVRYTYHPIPPLGPEPQADITTPEKEEILLSPMRIPRMRKQPQLNWANDGTKFDRTNLPPDKVSVELEVGPSILLAYGTIITSFMNLLENIFGEDQSFTDMQKTPNLDAYYWQGENGGKLDGGAPGVVQETSEGSTESDMFDTRRARPLDVTVSITLHDIQAHLVKNCSENEPPCPIVLIERFGFEMDKSFKETKLQLLLSPSILVSANNLSRTNPNNSGALYQGHLMLSSFQLRGHGFFSDAERSIEEDTIEYAWMMELQLGQLTGRLTLPQLYQIVSSLETFFLLVCDDENELSPPNPAKLCHHGLIDVQCPETDLTQKYRCPTPNEIKYRMIRVAVDLVDLYVADGNTALQTWVSPARLTFCNLHGAGAAAGVAALLPAVRLALYTQTNMQATSNSQHHHSGSSVGSQNRINDNETWLGVGTVAFGPVLIEANEALPQTPKNLHMVQHKFIKLHDEKTRRLWFLWPNTGKNGLCGCVGGCAFFGSNRNGPGFLKPCGTDLAEGVNVASFHVIDGAPGEFGYGQSLLHPGQLVFHTPPYGRHVRLHTPRPDPLSRTPRAPAPPPPGTAPPHAARRASYTSAGKPAAAPAPARTDVPYARLVDSSALLGSGKIDSDSKLNKAVLCVPALESSVSDSRLALSCALKEGSRRAPVEDPFMPRVAPARPVAVSESHYSLDSQPPGDDRVPPEVRRTMSITSENQSEAFFSADEDMFPSRSSSLKHSFGSRHSNTRERSFGMNETASERCWTVPAQKKPQQPDSISNLSGGVQPDSESGSVSSTSFISAISSQEDMTLVNLHMQTNKPIVESPLLMASYMHNLQQYRCSNWGSCSLPSGGDAFTLPLFRRVDDGTLLYVGQRYLPNFEPIGKGNVLRLISKKESQNSSGHGSLPMPNFNSVVRAHPYPASWWDAPQPGDGAEAGAGPAEGEGAGEPHSTSDSVVGVSVRLRGSVDAVLTPLVLESAQRFVESLTPVLANVHPATVLTHLRLLCISSVRAANVLKQKRYVLNWLPQMLAREGAGAGAGAGAGDAACELATIPRTNAYEETVVSRVSLTLGVPRVDVLMLQSAVVEDTISFSALDNIQDLTCVSLFGVSVEGVSGELALRRRAVERVQLYYRPPLRALATKKSFGIMKGARLLGGGARRPPDLGEPVYIESAQHQAEDIAFSLNIGKVHGQLRRIRNEACQLKDATITGIPSHYSKVSFTFARQEPPAEETTNGQNGTTESQKENAIGYIMFECGLEGVGVKVSRHSQQKVGEERTPAPPGPAPAPASAAAPAPGTPKEPDSARASVRSEERDRRSRTSGFEDLFRKKDSSSKPSTPNLGSAPPPPEAPPEPAAEGEARPPAALTQPAGNTSSCSVDLKVVWFNFAAPPRTPITRKIDYTRLDWNLLSTAAPAINAWMNPCNRLGVRVVALYRAHARRLAAAAACLMAGALDLAPHPAAAPPKSRYGRHTAMARQLREEPSLQLCGVLLRHALAADAAAVQADLADRHLPSLSTLRQGVIVLSRQWKNILYTPLLLEHGLRNKVLKPLNVTFALPELLEEAEWAAGVDGSGGVVGAATAAGVAGAGAGGSEPDAADENCLLLHSVPHTSDAEEAGLGLGSDGSVCSGASGGGGGGAGTTHTRAAALAGHATRTQRAREDLYQWMAKQEPVKAEPVTRAPMIPLARLNPVAAAAALPACSLYPLQGSLMLLDAHLVFQPLLRASGVCARQVQRGESQDGGGGGGGAQALESLGSRLALLAWVDTVRADIVVGELGRDARRPPRPEPPRADTAAFICEKVCLDAELRRVADAAVGEVVARRRVLYISRGQLKRHISTVLNFNLAVRHIEQQVNMPLLRLLHQISSMYQNVKDAQVELRGGGGGGGGPGGVAPAQDAPPSSSVSDFRENLVSVSSMDGGTQYSTLDSKWELLEEPPATPTPTPSADSVLPRAAPAPTPTPAPVSPAPAPAPAPARTRPQSFAQKLRSTGKSVKGKLGYSSLSEGAHTPMFPAPAPPPPLPAGAAGAGAGAGAGAAGADSLAPRCWRTLYLLLDLYAQMPDADTITHRFSVSTDLPEKCRGRVTRSQSARENSAPNVVAPMGIVVVGVARIHRTRLLASLSGLKLEAEITALQGSLSATRAKQWQLTGTLARSTIVLLEGAAPHHATVVRVSVGKSQALHSWEEGRAGRAARGAAVLLSVGGVRVELPQHPVALHGVMTRSSRQLSSTLQELGVGRASSRAARATEPDSPPPPARPPPPRAPAPPPPAHVTPDRPLLHSPQLQFSIAVQSLSITAALLPSLQAQYKMENVSSSGVTGDKAHFTIELPQHCLSFVTKLQASEANIPAAAMVALPPVHVSARVAEAGAGTGAGAGGVGVGPEGAVLRAGRYLAATADIGLFEHTLSTDLLNHLVFVQKVFMKEVNEVVQKVSGGEKPVPLWGEEAAPASPLARALFTLVIRIQRIQLTATTPSNSAVRLETGAVELELSNRVQNVPTAAADDVRLFARAQVDINLSLGQLIRNAMFEEAEPEFQQYAFFNTRISMRNAFQDEMPGTMPGAAGEGAAGARGAPGVSRDGGGGGEGGAGDVVLIRLKRPLVYVQPVAVDRAILVWLNYKNAYEYWNEKRRSLNTEVLHATQQLIEKVQQQSQLAAPLVTTLFLQLDVDDIGICLPLTPPPLLANA